MNYLLVICLFLNVFYNNLFVFSSDTECPNVTNYGDRRKNKNSLRLVQYNVEWLFIDYYSQMNCPGSGCTWHTEDEAYTHLTYVSNIIKELNPDIINLCEVEGCDELSLVVQNLDSELYNTYLKKGTDTGTGQNVGLITKVDPLINLYRTDEKISYPVPNSKCGYTGSPANTSVSKHYITEYNFGNKNVAFIGAHLLAIPTDPARCAQREAQSQILQNKIYEYIKKNFEIIVIGDMNDYDAEVLDLNSNKPTSRVLDILKGNDGEHKNMYKLTNVAGKINQNERYSDWWDSDNNCNTSSINDYSMIDHILVSEGIEKNIVGTFIYHGYKEYCGKLNSDHYPVVVDFVF